MFRSILYEMLKGSPSPDELQRLIDERVREGKAVDYKRTVETGDNKVREFCEDVTSFSNTEGGYLLIGLREAEKDGAKLDYPDGFAAHGLELAKFRARVDHVLESNVWPKLSGYVVDETIMPGGESVLWVRVLASTMGPHMVDRDGRISCAVRNSHGKRKLDAEELRSAILRSRSVETEFITWLESRRFRLTDFARRRNVSPPCFALHAFPREFLEVPTNLELPDLRMVEGKMRAGGEGFNGGYRPCLDGLQAVGEGAYSVAFHNGGFESANTFPFSTKNGVGPFIAGGALYETMYKMVGDCLATLRETSKGNILLSGTLAGVRRHHFLNGSETWGAPAGEENLDLGWREEDRAVDPEVVTKAWIDRVAQIHGFLRYHFN